MEVRDNDVAKKLPSVLRLIYNINKIDSTPRAPNMSRTYSAKSQNG